MGVAGVGYLGVSSDIALSCLGFALSALTRVG